MLGALRTTLLIGNAVAIPSALMLGWALTYGVDPVKFNWVTPAASAQATGAPTEFAMACEPRVLDQAIYSRVALAKFAAEAVIELNTFDYLNWDEVLQGAVGRFMTPEAGRTFMYSFERGRLLAGVQRNYLSASARLMEPPVIVSESSVGPVRSWTVQVPFEVFYGTGARTVEGVQHDPKLTQAIVATVKLVEQPPTARNFRGVAVSEFKAQGIPNRTMIERLRAE